jgi:hypothetical protein
MSNPYESPTATPSDERHEENRRIVIALIPFAIAVITMPVAIVAWIWSAAVVFGVAGAVLVFDLPVCVLVIVEWVRTGKPLALHLSPLIPSREEREFSGRLRRGRKLDDEEFYDRYFGDTALPSDLPGRLRRTLENALGMGLGALDPDVSLVDADWEIDWGDVLVEIEEDFQISVPRDSFTETITFRTLLDCVCRSLSDGVNSEKD